MKLFGIVESQGFVESVLVADKLLLAEQFSEGLFLGEESLDIDDISDSLECIVWILNYHLIALRRVGIVLEDRLGKLRAKASLLLGRIDEELGEFSSELANLLESVQNSRETSELALVVVQQEVVPVRVDIDG